MLSMEKYIETKLKDQQLKIFNRHDLINKYIYDNNLINVSLDVDNFTRILCDNPVKHAIALTNIIYAETKEKYMLEQKTLSNLTQIIFRFNIICIFYYNPTFSSIPLPMHRLFKDLFVYKLLIAPIINYDKLNTLINYSWQMPEIGNLYKKDKGIKKKTLKISNDIKRFNIDPDIVIKKEDESKLSKEILKSKKYNNLFVDDSYYYNVDGVFIFLVDNYSSIPFNNITRIYFLLQKCFILRIMSKDLSSSLYSTTMHRLNEMIRKIDIKKELENTKHFLRTDIVSQSRELQIKRVVDKTLSFKKYIPYKAKINQTE